MTRPAGATSTAGYVVGAAVFLEQEIGEGDEAQTLRIPTGGPARVAEDGAFSITVGDEIQPVGSIALIVKAPDGTQVLHRTLDLEDVQRPLVLRVATLQLPLVEPSLTPTVRERPTLRGRMIAERGRKNQESTKVDRPGPAEAALDSLGEKSWLPRAN